MIRALLRLAAIVWCSGAVLAVTNGRPFADVVDDPMVPFVAWERVLSADE